MLAAPGGLLAPAFPSATIGPAQSEAALNALQVSGHEPILLAAAKTGRHIVLALVVAGLA